MINETKHNEPLCVFHEIRMQSGICEHIPWANRAFYDPLLLENRPNGTINKDNWRHITVFTKSVVHIQLRRRYHD